MGEEAFSYIDYIEKNPLYLHNNKEDFNATLNQIPNLEPTLSHKVSFYLNYLEQEENKILQALTGDDGISGEEKLNFLADAAFRKNRNTPKVLKLLDDLFNKQAGSITFNTGKEDKNNYFLNIPGASLKLIKVGERKTRGRTENIYDFEQSLNQAKIDGTYDNFKKSLDIFVSGVTKVFNNHDELYKELNKLIQFDLLTVKDGSIGVWSAVQEYLSNMERYVDPNTDFLEFLRTLIGRYSALKGQFDEATRMDYELEIKKMFGDSFKRERGDRLTSKNKKPDIIFYGGQLDLDTTPITISKKALSGSSAKLQTSALYGDNGNSGIYSFLKQEDKLIADIYTYLTINDAFYPEEGADKILNMIVKYLSYIFISGTSQDKRIDQALYFVATSGSGDKMEVRFTSISSIIKAILADAGFPVKIDKISGDNKNLSQLLEAKHNAYKYAIEDSFGRKQIEYNYEFLSKAELPKNILITKVAKNVITSARKVELSLKYIQNTSFKGGLV